MSIYNQIYRIVEGKKEEDLWRKNCEFLYGLFMELENSMIKHFEDKLHGLHDTMFLEKFDVFWSSVRLYTHWNITIFTTVDGYSKLILGKSLLQSTLEMLRKVILSFNEKLSTAALKELLKDRNRDEVRTDLIRTAFRAYFEVDYENCARTVKIGDSFHYVYDESQDTKAIKERGEKRKQKTSTFCEKIKEKLIQETTSFYAKKVNEWLGLAVPDFLEISNRYLNEEKNRIEQYYPYEKADVLSCVTEQIIHKTASKLVINQETGLLHMLQQKEYNHVRILYEFLDEVNHPLETFTAHLLDFTQKQVDAIKNQASDEDEKETDNTKQQIENIILFKQEILKLCNDCCKKNKAIINSVRLELQRSFANVDDFPNKLAAYVDAFILENGKNMESDEIQQKINEIFDMISLTTERDKFLFHYESGLSKLPNSHRNKTSLHQQLQ